MDGRELTFPDATCAELRHVKYCSSFRRPAIDGSLDFPISLSFTADTLGLVLTLPASVLLNPTVRSMPRSRAISRTNDWFESLIADADGRNYESSEAAAKAIEPNELLRLPVSKC